MRKLCRVLFSRYAVSFLIIVADVVLLTLLALHLSSYGTVFTVLLLFFDGTMLLHLVNRETSPENKLPWAVIILTLPVLGALLYALFFSRKLSRRERRHLQRMDTLTPTVSERTEALSSLGQTDAYAAGCAMAILGEDATAKLVQGTEATYFDDGAAMFRAMVEDLGAARRYIFLETFIIDEGVMWDTVHDLLRQKVAEGVEVRLLYDDIGCMKTLPRDFDARLRAEGIDAHRFAPVTPRITVAHNNRDHRKIVAIDGAVAYTGGINFADEYIHKRERFGVWKDGGIRLCGAAAMGFVRLFLRSFDITAFTLTDPQSYRPTLPMPKGDGGYYLPFGSGPVPLYTSPVGKHAFLNLIMQARRYLYVTTPYLIMDYEMTTAFTSAAKRGVDVRILVPHIPDKRTVFLMTRTAYPTLLAAGVRIYEYTPGFLHEKLLVCDDRYAIVGTINLDFRSFAHHFECAVWMYRSTAIAAMRDGIMRTLAASQRIHEGDAALTLPQRILRSLIRLFSPLF